MEPDEIFSGGVRGDIHIARAKAGPTEHVPTKVVTPEGRRVTVANTSSRSLTDKRVAEHSVSPTERAKQKSIEAKEKAAQAEIKAKEQIEIQAKKTAADELARKEITARLQTPSLKEKLKSVLGKAAEKFGIHPPAEKVKAAVKDKVDTIRSEADAKARKKAADAEAALSDIHRVDLANEKASLSAKEDVLTAQFNEKMRNINREHAPERAAEVDAVNARDKAKKHLDDERIAKEKTGAHEGDSTRAKGSGDHIDEPTTRVNEGDIVRERLQENDADLRAREAREKANKNLDDERIAKEKGGAHEGDSTRAKDSADNVNEPHERINEPDGHLNEPDPVRERLQENDAELRAREAREKAKKNLDDERIAKEKGGAHEGDSTRAKDSGDDINEPRDRLRDNTPEERERLRDSDAEERAREARDKADEHLKDRSNLSDKVRAFLKGLLGLIASFLLGLLFITVLPPPLTIGTPGGDHTVTLCPGGPGCDYVEPPPPTVPVDVIHPPGTSGSPQPGTTQPPAPPPVPEGPEETGTIIFTLMDKPDEDISIQILTNSENLEFDQDSIHFSVDSWDTPVAINYITTLNSSAGQLYSANKAISVLQKMAVLKRKVPVSKAEKYGANIVQASLDEYSPTIEEIRDRKKRLEYLLSPDEDIESELSKIRKRIKKKEHSYKAVEPVYDSDQYKSYYGGQNSVEPVYDENLYKEFQPVIDIPLRKNEIYNDEENYVPYEPIIEPVYDDGYTSYGEEVIPTFEGGQDDQEEQEEENQSPEDIIDSLDVDTLIGDFDHYNIDDSLKAEIDYTLMSAISFDINISIEVQSESNMWVIEPSSIYFGPQQSATTTYFFSEEIFSELLDLHFQDQSSQQENNFSDAMDTYHEDGMNKINNKEQEYNMLQQQAYDDAYQESIDEDNEQINDGEEILNTLSGGSKFTQLKRYNNRTRKKSK